MPYQAAPSPLPVPAEVVTLAVGEADNGQRLDVFLTAQLVAKYGAEAFSRVRVQQLIKDNFVQQDGKASSNPAKKMHVGEVFVVDVPAVIDSTLVAEDIPLEILYEDDDLLVINKEAGLTVHPAVGHVTGTLVHALLWHCKDQLSGINGEARPGIVHRLDKDTSGVMVVAKSDKAHRGLAKQFAAHTLHRSYLVLVKGMPLPAAGKIESRLARDPQNRLRQMVLPMVQKEELKEPWVTEQKYARQQQAATRIRERAAGIAGAKNAARGDDPALFEDDEPEEVGKLAVTHYQVEQVFGAGTKMPVSLVRCRLETGRTHQIRVHMAHKGWPVLNDPLYGKRLPAGQTTLPGQALHAAELGFTHPVTGDWLEFASELPAGFADLVSKLDEKQ